MVSAFLHAVDVWIAESWWAVTWMYILILMYNTRDASREAINAAFSREADSLVSVERWWLWEQHTYVSCWRAILFSLSPCRLQSPSSSVSETCEVLYKHVLRFVPGVRTHNLRAGPNNKTFLHTYIHLPRFRLHTAWSLASLPTRQISMTATSDQCSSLKGSSQNACMHALRCMSTGTISVSEEWAWSAWMGVACRFIIVSPIRSPTHCDC